MSHSKPIIDTTRACVCRYIGPDGSLEAPWGVAPLKTEPRITRAKGTTYVLVL